MVRKARRMDDTAQAETRRDERHEEEAASAAAPLLDDETIQAILDAIVPE